MTDACDSDVGTPHDLIMAFDPQQSVIGNVVGAQGVIQVVFDTWPEVTMPDYWSLEPGGCRDGSLTLDTGFAGLHGCPEAWSQATSVSSSVQVNTNAPCYNRIILTWTVSTSEPVVFDGNIVPDWYLARLRFDRSGTTTCVGCSLPACFWATDLYLFRPAGDPEGTMHVTEPAVGQHVTWQGGGTLNCPGTGSGGSGDPTNGYCPTPTLQNTWGMIKTMYR